MLSADELSARRAAAAAAPDLAGLMERVSARAEPLIRRGVEPPELKARLTADGGICPADGSPLEFDPWRAGTHRCVSCGREHAGARHDAAWARWQHLWLAERAAELSALASLGGREDAVRAANTLLAAYAARYETYPNRDNVLGPSRLFFSTYLESIWLGNYLAAAWLLREAGALEPGVEDGVSAVANEAANLIGEFDEGFSNRQTWHNAALAAIAVWFEDEELAGRVVEGGTGIIAHLVRGFGGDGMWYEGENYHLFALRGQLLAMGWARQAGVDILGDGRLAARLEGALRAPALTALPDFTFPARKDSRFGVSLAQPMYLELWEIGAARLGAADSDLWDWLRALYASPAPPAERFDSYLHESGAPAPPAGGRSRSDLSWWALLEMVPSLPEGGSPWQPGNTLLESQGLAILRRGDRYASLECGPYGGGHGHPDRLHLTLHAGGRHWLPDPGTGSYVARDLFWYRSTLAHNAPALDGRSQPPDDAECAAFGESGNWAWVRGRYRDFIRTVVAGPRYLLDVLELSAEDEHRVELSWHPNGAETGGPPGHWEPVAEAAEFVKAMERLVPAGDGPLPIRTGHPGAGALALHLDPAAELLRAVGPGLPNAGAPAMFYVQRAHGSGVRLVSVVEPVAASPFVRGWRSSGDLIEVETDAGVERHVQTSDGWEITTATDRVALRGVRRTAPRPGGPLIDHGRRTPMTGLALGAFEPPPLDGTLERFDFAAPLELDHEDQYRRSEDPFPGPEEFSATAAVQWDGDALYLAVDVRKPELRLRPADAPPLLLDNDPDDIHADGVQVYLRPAPDRPLYGFLVVLSSEEGGIRVRPAGGTAGTPEMVRGAWRHSEQGYTLTLALALPAWDPRPGAEVEFDLLVNRVEEGRERRSGQLVWSGGGGWVYLRGDRHDPAALGVLELR